MDLLDRTEQRIVGVLIEKQLTVPDSYPLTENALLSGCNQSSNRDPVLELQRFEVAGAMMALHEKEWVARVEGGSRVPKYRHRTEERCGVDKRFLPILCELLVRGPQAPGALKPRVARMGLTADASEIEAMLRELAGQPRPLVEQMPRRPRERDDRWQHLLGGASEAGGGAPAANAGYTTEILDDTVLVQPPIPAVVPVSPEVEGRLAELEQKVAGLERILATMQKVQRGD